MDTKKISVKLVNDDTKVGALELEINHAERLLKMPNNGGWKLPKDTPYKLEKNGLIKKSDNSTTEIAEKQIDDK